MRGEVLRYLGWQVVDRTGPRLLACLFISAAIMIPFHFAMAESTPEPGQLANLQLQMHQQFAFIFAIIFGNGLIATDRVQGHFRFYFAKPVSPLWFYGQHVVLALVATLAASAGFVTLFSLAVRPLWDFAPVGRGLALFLMFTLPIVLFSTLSKHDWLWAVALLVVSATLKGRFPVASGTVGEVVHAVLPPTHLLGVSHQPTPSDWAWMTGWAIGFFVLTLVLLARRPLGED